AVCGNLLPIGRARRRTRFASRGGGDLAAGARAWPDRRNAVRPGAPIPLPEPLQSRQPDLPKLSANDLAIPVFCHAIGHVPASPRARPCGGGMTTPAISVLTSAYNAERYLAQAIDSILNQTFGDFEFIIVDDGSKDRTLQILRDYEKR